MSVSSINFILLDLTYKIRNKIFFQINSHINPIYLLIYKIMEAFSKNFSPTVRKRRQNNIAVFLTEVDIIILMEMVYRTGLHHQSCSCNLTPD